MLFTCSFTRALNFKLTKSLSTEWFTDVFQKLAARRCKPLSITIIVMIFIVITIVYIMV